MAVPAITVENLGKAYRIGLKDEIPDTIVGAMTGWVKAPMRNFRKLSRLNTFRQDGASDADDIVWALKDVSFEVAEGEVLGIIGRNGAGKSTLLKVLSRITEPTSGQAVIRGRVSSLLEVGTGFHPEMTGRENVYMNGTILGMRKKEIDRKFDEIVDFSGVEKFLDTPIKRYSSGMKVRLAFAVAAHLEPEILIIDEVLAVGDAEFQRKCLGKMQDVASSGRTVLFVSHQLGAVESLCSRVITLVGGEVRQDGLPRECIDEYLTSGRQYTENGFNKAVQRQRAGSGEARIARISLVTSDSVSTDQIPCGDSFAIETKIDVQQPIDKLHCVYWIQNIAGQRLFRMHSADVGFQTEATPPALLVRSSVESCPLLPGLYEIRARLVDGPGRLVDDVRSALQFQVSEKEMMGFARMPGGKREVVFVQTHWEALPSSGK